MQVSESDIVAFIERTSATDSKFRDRVGFALAAAVGCWDRLCWACVVAAIDVLLIDIQLGPAYVGPGAAGESEARRVRSACLTRFANARC